MAGSTLDIHEQMMRLTLAVAGKTLLDTNVEADVAGGGPTLAIAGGSWAARGGSAVDYTAAQARPADGHEAASQARRLMVNADAF